MVTSLQEYCYFYITKNKYVSLFSLESQFYLLILHLKCVEKQLSETVIYKIFAKLSLNTRTFLSCVYKECRKPSVNCKNIENLPF